MQACLCLAVERKLQIKKSDLWIISKVKQQLKVSP